MKKITLLFSVCSIFFVQLGFAQLGFEPRVDYPTGNVTAIIETADLNGDNILDLVVPNGTLLSVSLGTGSGSFGTPLNISLGGLPVGIAIRDFNGDNKLDIAVANNLSDNVHILIGTGTGSFDPPQNYPLGFGPQRMVSGDFNGDTFLDLAITTFSDVKILLGTGLGTFSAAASYLVGTYPVELTTKDFNADNILDLAVSNLNSANLSILLGDGSGIFNPVQTIASGTNSSHITSEDFNSDGIPDLVVSNSSNRFSLFTGTGTGTFNSPQHFIIGGPNGPSALRVMDFNTDGKLDLAVGNANNSTIGIYYNDGVGGFVLSQSIPVGPFPSYFLIANLNGDALIDIASSSLTTNTFGVLLGVLLPSITSFTPISGPIGTTVTINGTSFSTTPANNIVKFNGITVAVTASTATSISTTVPIGASTGAIAVTVSGNTATSTSNFTVTIPTITITTQPSDVVACVGATATFSVVASGTTNIAYQWQYSPDGIVPFADIINGAGYSNATTPTLSINTTGNFGAGRYRCRINGDFVPEVISNDEGLFINSLPASPGSTGNSVCGNGNVKLNATGGASGQYRWYTSSTGGTPITGEVNDTYTTPTIAATTTYYVSINNGTCESPRASVVAQINTPPAAPTVTGESAFPPAVLTLTASGGTNGQYRWYTTASGGTALAGEVNSTYTTPSLTTSTTYYVSINNGQCESSRTPVEAGIKVNSAPVILSTNAEVPVEGTITISLTALISDPEDNLDFSTLTIVKQPTSGAIASIEPVNNLVLDYSGTSFSGTDQFTIGICDQLAACAQKELTIEVTGDIIVYNALSPNGDGKNDMFYIQNINLLPETKNNRVLIFNRWGDIVFEAENYDNVNQVFSGLNKSGNELPSGTYYYRIEFAGGKETKTGFIALRK